MENLIVGVAACFLLLIVGFQRIFSERQFVSSNKFVIDLALYSACFGLLVYLFYSKHLWAGVVVSILAGVTVIKYLVDKHKSGKEN